MDHPSARHRHRTQARRRRLHDKAARRNHHRISHAVPIGTQHLHAALPLPAEDIAPRVHRPAAVMALLTGPASWQRDITAGYARPRAQRVHARGPRRTAGTCAGTQRLRLFSVTGVPVAFALGWQSSRLLTDHTAWPRSCRARGGSTLSVVCADVAQACSVAWKRPARGSSYPSCRPRRCLHR
jgi:hypothetical protein